MDPILAGLISKLDEMMGGLIDAAAMPADEKSLLKSHLLVAQDILVRNGENRLKAALAAISQSILSRF